MGYKINELRTLRNEKRVNDPLSERTVSIGKAKLASNLVDEMLLSGSLKFDVKDEGLVIDTDKREFKVQFDASRFRPSEVPILLSDTEKIRKELGVLPTKQISDIINDQINYYLDGERRRDII